MGRILCTYVAAMISSDIIRLPVMLEARSYSLAASVVLGSALASGMIIRRKLDRLNLVEVLKTKE
jgi:putative ABC transport system permease protein